VLKDRDNAAKRVKDAAEKDKEYTEALKGVPPDKKGLHAELRDEFLKLAMIEAEYDELRPQWLNNKVELQNLTELRDRLNERIQQLGGKPVSEGPANQ
jgi:chromosome segregation ATPase